MALKRLLLGLLFILVGASSVCANQAARGWCESGAQVVITSGLTSTTQVQASFPSCTIQVLVHGGGTANIFSDANGTPLANPFTAQTGGQWQFYAANGHYDVVMSGAGFPTPVTYSDVYLNDAANQAPAIFCQAVTYAATLTFNATNNACYQVTLTGNLIVVIGGTPANGNLLKLELYQDNVGGHTVIFPSNFNTPSGWLLLTGALAHNDLTWNYDQSNTWQPFDVWGVGSGGAGCSVAGSTGDLQKNNGSGGCAASSINDNNGVVNVSNPFDVNADTQFKGPNPSADVRSYGSIADNISGTASCAGTTTITLGGVYAFTNGEGVAIQGCGPTPALTTPPAPTVVTGNLIGLPVPNSQLTSATGSSTYTYWFVDRTLNGGLSAAGTQTTIANGLPLGMQSTAATSYSLTGHMLTITFSATPNVANGTHFSYDGMTNSTFGTLKSQVTGTTGTTITATVANYCATTCTGTGGTFTWENGNKVSRALQSSPVWQSYICGERPGDVSGHILGATDPALVNYTGSGYSDYESGSVNTPTVFTWSDFGATQSNPTPFSGFGTFPYYITDSICGNVSVTPESLFTTIVSGAGTASIVVANAASQTVSGQTIQSDAGAGIQAADNAAFNGPSNIRGSITIPDVSATTTGRFIVHRPLLLKSLVYLVGNVLTGETITLKGALIGVKSNASSPQFAWLGTSYINGNQGAYPVVIVDSDQDYIGSADLQVNATNASKVLLMARNQNETIDQVSFATGTGSNDYCGMSIEIPPAAFNFRLKDVTSINGPNQVGNSSWCPSIFFYNVAAGATIAHLSIEGDSYISPRGIYIDGTGFPLSTMNFDNYYSQGPVFPLLSVFNVAAPQIAFSKCTQLADTSAAQIIDIENVGGPGSLSNIYTCGLANTASGNVLPFTGTQGGVPSIADFPNLPGQVLPTPFLQPGTTGRTTLGQNWAAYYTLVPQITYPTAVVGFNLGFLSADALPSFKDTSANKYFLATWLSTVTPINGHCPVYVVAGGITTLGDFGAGCGSAPGSPSLSIQYNCSGLFCGIPVPSAPNGVAQNLCSTPVGGVGTTGVFCLPGVLTDARTTTAETINATDRLSLVTFNNGSAIAVTLPQAGSGGGGNNDFTHSFAFKACDIGAGTATITPTTSTISYATPGSYTSGASSMPLTKGQCAFIYTDATGANYVADFVSGSFVNNVETNGTPNSNINLINFVNPANFNGLTFTFSNPSGGNETFTVGGTLGNGGLTNPSTTVNGQTCTLGSTCTIPGTTLTIANAASTGTTTNTLTTITGAPSTAVIVTHGALGGAVGITTAGAGTTGSATITTGEQQVSCVFDGATVADDYVQISPTVDGNCHDAGAPYPSSGQVIGRVQSTNAAGGTFTIILFPAEIRPTSNVIGSSIVGSVSSNQSVTLATGPSSAQYQLNYYADQNALCGSGSETVSFTFNWTDASNARSLTTGSLTLGSAQSATTGYISGTFIIKVASGNVTYTSTFNGACASGGPATYDINVSLVRIQ